MIIQSTFHTYKEDSPIIINDQLPPSYNWTVVNSKMTNLILELSDLTNFAMYVYITRHTNDKIPKENITPFITKFSNFISHFGNKQQCSLPTIWFVGHFESYGSVQKARAKLNAKKITYFENTTEVESFESINDTYWDNIMDAHLFPKFLHQVTMIGIDLLRGSNIIQKLEQLKCLEWLLYKNPDNMISDLDRMREFLDNNSQFYREEVCNSENEAIDFWKNFEKVKMEDIGNGKMK